jgi:hypothetical protein
MSSAFGEFQSPANHQEKIYHLVQRRKAEYPTPDAISKSLPQVEFGIYPKFHFLIFWTWEPIPRNHIYSTISFLKRRQGIMFFQRMIMVLTQPSEELGLECVYFTNYIARYGRGCSN